MTNEASRAERGRPATKVGVVTSDKMEKSVVVRVDRTVRHGMYKRFVRLSSTFMAHDEANACKVGDTVEIVESRPLSRHKRWRVRRVLRAAVGTGRAAEPTAD
jgi:small subunit ribosomal protein S17